MFILRLFGPNAMLCVNCKVNLRASDRLFFCNNVYSEIGVLHWHCERSVHPRSSNFY